MLLCERVSHPLILHLPSLCIAVSGFDEETPSSLLETAMRQGSATAAAAVASRGRQKLRCRQHYETRRTFLLLLRAFKQQLETLAMCMSVSRRRNLNISYVTLSLQGNKR